MDLWVGAVGRGNQSGKTQNAMCWGGERGGGATHGFHLWTVPLVVLVLQLARPRSAPTQIMYAPL